MRKMLDTSGLCSQLKTWSSVHNYMQKHPSDTNVVDAFMETLDLPKEQQFEVEWPIGLMLMKKSE